MSRALLILSIWLALAALIAGVAHLARPCGCSRVAEPGPARLSAMQAPSGSVAATVIAEPAPAKSPAPHATPHVPATSSAAATRSPAAPAAGFVPARDSSSAVASVIQEPTSGTSTPPAAPKQDPPKPPRKHRQNPDDPGDTGENGGLGVLPKGVDPEYEGLGVTCVNASTGRPVPDVQVRAMTAKDLAAWASAHPGKSVEDEDPKVVLEAATSTAKTNTWGIAITESGPGRMLVDARTPLLYAFTWVDRDKVSRAQLTIVPDLDVVFRTRAQDGSPRAGVPVVVTDAWCQEIWRGVSAGEDATVRMPHAEFLMARSAVGDCTAYVEGLLPASTPVDLVRGKLPTKTVDLVVPASRALRVTVKDPTGKTVTQPFVVTLSTIDPVQVAREGYGGQGGQSATCKEQPKRTTKDGIALFERVQPMAKDVKFRLVLDGGDVYATASQEVDASSSEVEVSFTRAFPVARVKVEDTAGKPLSRAKVKTWAIMHGFELATAAGRGEYTTDADGTLRIPCAQLQPSGQGSPVALTQYSDLALVALDPSGDSLASVTVPLPSGFTSGERDLGTARMIDLPFVVQGYVVDDRDVSVPGARVSVRALATPEPGRTPLPALDCGAVSDSSGFFKLRANVPDGDVDLSCDAPDHLMLPHPPVQRGDKKVRIVMSRFGTLVSKVLMPPGMPNELVKIAAGGDQGALSPDANDIVHFTQLAPGKTKLEVTVTGIAAPILSLPDVEVKPGVEVVDPRALQIDLRQRVFHRTLHVNDPDGKPIGYVSGRIVEPSEDRRPPRKITATDGEFRFVTLQPTVDVNLSAPGFVTKEVHGVDKDMDVTLERGPK